MKRLVQNPMRRAILQAAAAGGFLLVARITPAHAQAGSLEFSASDIRIIRAFFEALVDDDRHGKGKGKGRGKGQGGGLPPGLAKRDELPPGLARQVQKHGRLPPGIEMQMLPPDLLRRLPPLRTGFERVIVNRQVVLIEKATHAIHDILVIADILDGR